MITSFLFDAYDCNVWMVFEFCEHFCQTQTTFFVSTSTGAKSFAAYTEIRSCCVASYIQINWNVYYGEQIGCHSSVHTHETNESACENPWEKC